MLTLADVVDRGISVEWNEAVALVRAVAERLLGTPGRTHHLPELHEVLLMPDGRVELAGGAPVGDPVRRLGQLLQAALGQSQPPVQLRLLISQAMAPSPAFASIGEYDEALAYFERPGRGAVLKAVYDRTQAVPSAASTKSNLTLDAVAPLPVAEVSEESRSRSRRARARVRPVAIGVAAGLAVVAGVGAVLYLRPSAVPDTAHVSAATAKASNVLGAAVVSGLSAVTERVGLGRIVTAGEPAGAPPPEASTPAPPRPVVKPTEEGRPAQVKPGRTFAAFDLEPRTGPRLPSVPAPSPVPPLDPARATGSTPIDERIIVTASADGWQSALNVVAYSSDAVYTQESSGVIPPVGIRPQLRTELPSDLNPGDLGQLELLILPDGTVESVKLIGVPRNVHDFMFLSAAKAWLFQPAVRDGLPVRYRKTVWFMSPP